ncbi:sodium-translocating pyrophosphatase [Candidatus Marinamargulisbacteria bacterium SCGC AG-439-L15]|nr:sodium-translocating pyrophosphatase [Candidatus Marinamargulisbacteria bacterium SCGC AG-439-L15]
MFQSIPNIWWLAPIAAAIALLSARLFYTRLLLTSEGTDKMAEIAGYVKEGAMAYLKQQYRIVGIVFAVLFVILLIMVGLGVQSPLVPFVFLSGGLWSAVSGYLGMKTATNASARTAAACRDSLNKGLKVSFRSGAVMGLIVVGFGLLDISIWFLILNFIYNNNIFGLAYPLIQKLGIANWDSSLIHVASFQKAKFTEMTTTLLAYSMGASVMALFSRVGGGIFTKAADVGADLVGKVEAGIPEDDPRNPATIADNVGDNVGDVAGMGADLFESYCGSILATAALGTSIAMITAAGLDIKAIIAPMVVAGGGIIFSLIGIFMVKTDENADQKALLKALHLGTNISAALTLIFIGALAFIGFLSWGIFGAVASGLIAGTLIGHVTEYYTSDHFKPTQDIAKNTLMGSATTIIHGIAVGMFSSGIPVIIIGIGIMSAYIFAGGANSVAQGIYGIAFAAIGMLSTLGITLATDAFGPIADNAGGNAEMAGLPPEVRERTDALDSLGNTTAATGKGFAIGSAALTALALIAAYLDSVKLWIAKLAETSVFYIGKVGFTTVGSQANPAKHLYDITSLDTTGLVQALNVTVINPQFLVGLFLGGMVAFVFCALTILAVGTAAGEMVNEVRRQFKEIPGILEGTGKPEYSKCVMIATLGAQREIIKPSMLAILTPVIVGLVLGVAGVLGLLVGALTTGFSLAIKLNNSGGAWDNAKKYIEKGAHGGKGTDAHKAAVVGDTIGDPFKDTAGPSLNILIKLMTIVSIVFAGVILKFGIALF